MRMLTNALLAMFAATVVSTSGAAAASQDWKQSCTGPEHACSSVQPAAKAKATIAKSAKTTKVAKVKAKKPAAVADAPVKKKTKKIAKAPVKAKKQIAQVKKAKPAKVAQKKSKGGSSGGSSYQSGVASWYGGKFHGRTTANGEKYNMWSMTAAHKTLPFGTRVKVTNTSNGDTVIVRINDRGPFIAGRVIDLSKAAANEIGMGGLAPVKLTILGKG